MKWPGTRHDDVRSANCVTPLALEVYVVFSGEGAMFGSSPHSTRKPLKVLGIGALLLAFAGLSGQSMTGQRQFDWPDYAGSPGGSRYVPLTQITKDNVKQLQVAWTYPHGATGFNPLVVRGTIYLYGRNNSLIALDAATGKEVWIHDGLANSTRRGFNYWESADGRDRRLIFAVDDYLQEVDAATGKSISAFGTNGAVDLREGLGRDPKTLGRIQSTTPGKVFENLIILGSTTGEAYFSPPGDLRAYDILTGKLVWQFHTVPHPGEFGYETWPKDAWKYIGGTNTWGEISVDAARGIAYFPTGSPTFDYYGADRIGANLFANCLLALDARTGKRLWHFQNVHHDLWDFDNVSAPMLTTIRRNNQPVDIVALAGKTGYLYVFDRVTGEPIWPIEERPVPTRTDVPGEQPWPTQPFPTNPPPFGRQRFTVDDLNPYFMKPLEREQMRRRIMSARNDGQFTPIGFDEVVHMPGNHGGSNWGATSADPNGAVYVISYNIPALMRLLKPGEVVPSGRMAGAAPGPGIAVYQRTCLACHGPNREGVAGQPPLIGIFNRLSVANVRMVIQVGAGQMPGFDQLTADEVDALIAYLRTADSAGRGAGPGRGGGPIVPTFPPGPVVASGPVVKRAEGLPVSPNAYPEGVESPADRLLMDGYGLHPDIINPPFTTLTAYDLNRGTIKWQIALGDDPRLAALGIKGTGAAITLKGSVIPTATGLLFVNTADQKIHVYDAATGLQITELPLGATSLGSPSMYELNGRQFLLVTASKEGARGGPTEGLLPDGPTGLVAYALPQW